MKVGGVSQLSFVPDFLMKLKDCDSQLVDLAHTVDWLAEQRSTTFVLGEESTERESADEKFFLGKSQTVVDELQNKYRVDLGALLESVRELLDRHRKTQVSFDELRRTIGHARDIVLGIVGCLWGERDQGYREALQLYLNLDLFHWALCQSYELPPIDQRRKSRSRIKRHQEDLIGLSNLSLDGSALVLNSEPSYYFEKLFAESYEGKIVSSPVYWSVFLGFPSVMREELDGFPHAAIWMFQQMEYDRQWGTLRSLILRILGMAETWSYSVEPILKYYLGLSHLHLGDPRRASVYFKEIIPDSPVIGGFFSLSFFLFFFLFFLFLSYPFFFFFFLRSNFEYR